MTTAMAKRWLALILAVVLFAAACGDDGGDDAAPADGGSDDGGSDDGGSDDGGSDDGGSDDGGSDDGGSDDGGSDDGGSDDGGSDDGGSGDVPTFGNCQEFADAIDGLDDLADAGDPTSGSTPDDVRADFARAQASLAALQSQLPDDLKDDAQVIADGLAAMEEAFASIGYDASTLTDPADALQFAGVISGPEVLAMAGASINIQQWVTAGCN